MYIDETATQEDLRPFPYWPGTPNREEMKRMELMMEVNKWANNDAEIAKRSAESLIRLVSKQFGLNVRFSPAEAGE